MMKPTPSLLLLCLLPSQVALVASFTCPKGIETKRVFHSVDRALRFSGFPRQLSTNVKDGLQATPAAYLPDDFSIPRKEIKFVSDFKEGFNQVHSDYLNLFWKFSFRGAMRYILPVFAVLASTHFLVPELGQTLSYGFDLLLRGFHRLSSVVDLMLFLPLKASFAVATTLPPLVMIPMLQYMPRSAAVWIIYPILFLQQVMNYLRSSFLFSTLSVAVWRPLLEEMQYRFLLSSALGDKGLRRWFGRWKSNSSESAEIDLNMERNGLSVSKSAHNSISKTCLWTSFLFALTRFGWICSSFDDGTTSPYSWTVGFSLSLLGHLSSIPLSEVRSMLKVAFSMLALHQAVTTFLVAVNIYQPVYNKHGLMGSIGSHVAWTTGIPTIPFRLAKKLYDGTKKRSNTTVITDRTES